MTIKTFLPIILAAAFLDGAPVAAGEYTCMAAYRVAQDLMELRQLGMSMPEAMDIVAKFHEHPEWQATVRIYVQQIYERPRHTDPRLQQLAISEFANEKAASCYRALEK